MNARVPKTKTKAESGRSPALLLDTRKVARARIALHDATNGDALIKAAFRLLLATVRGDYAAISAHCSPMWQGAIWMTSRGDRAWAGDGQSHAAEPHWAIPYATQHPGVKILCSLDAHPEDGLVRDQARCSGHAIALCIWQDGSPQTLECVFSLNRTEAQGGFTGVERERLAALHPEIARAAWRLHRAEQERSARWSLEHLVRDLPLAVAILSWELEPLYHNAQWRKACAEWRFGAGARHCTLGGEKFAIPPDLAEVCMTLKEEWRYDRPGRYHSRAIEKRVVHPDGDPSFRATISLVQHQELLTGEPNFLIVFQQPEGSPASPPATVNLAALAELTPCEREVALAAAAGKDNAEIAAELGRCIGTVKAALHAVFAKLRVHKRTQLLGRLR